MTLNILILTRHAIYQSTDYRLSSYQTGQPVGTPSTKRVTVSYLEWRGFLTYTGIGQAGGIDTADWASRWLEGNKGASFDEVAELVCRRGTDWVRRYKPGQRHTFVLTGFEAGIATAAVISNYENGSGKARPTAGARLSVSKLTFRSHPIVLATGRSDLVSRSHRSRLRHLAERHAREGVRVRRAMARINADVAAASKGTVSPECWIYTQDSAGHGSEEGFGDTRTQPRDLLDGVDLMTDDVRKLLDEQLGQGWSVVATTFGVSNSGHI